MRRIKCLAIISVFSALAGSAHAAITFSNVTIAGSLSTGATFGSANNSIDFYFPNALVGDPVDPLRTGNIQITYEATSTAPMVQDQMILSILGALSGSGTIFVNEVVEDLDAGGAVLATYNALLDDNTDLPHTAILNFDGASRHIKVKKSFFLNAVPDTASLDLAGVGVVEQTIREVPEPATLTLLAILGLARIRRR